MYLEHYQMTAKPFSISADPDFLWLGEKHKEALAVLKYGVLDNRGFLLLTGDVGTGKTTLIHALLKSLGQDVLAAGIPDSGMDRMDFYNYIIHAFKIKKTFATKGEFLIFFEKFLRYARYKGLKVLLIIDEAQRLSVEMLEEIRVLSNFERDGAKLLNVFFVGQNEFNDILVDPRNKALRQRITITYNLKPLSWPEIKAYVEYRLDVGGVKDREIFSPGALEAIYRLTEGYPRRINVLCDHALLTGYVKAAQVIDAGIIEECAAELEIPGKAESNSDADAESGEAQKPPAWQIVNDPSEIKKTAVTRRTIAYIAAAIFVILAAVYWIRPDIYQRSTEVLSRYFKGASGTPEKPFETRPMPAGPGPLSSDGPAP